MPTRTNRKRTEDQAAGQAGIYRHGFQPGELQALEAMLDGGLENEIAMLRAITRRVFQMAHGIDDLDEAIEALRALGISASRLAGLLRTQAELGEAQDQQLAGTIAQALMEMSDEMRQPK